MSKRLHRITEELRAEKCPPHVLAKIRERIAQERAAAQPARFPAVRLAFAGACAALLVFAALRWFPGTGPVRSAAPTLAGGLTAEQVADQTHLSLACIGSTFVEA